MNNLIEQNESLTMSSREIAEYTDKQHSHVIRDIKKLYAELYNDDPSMDDLRNEGKQLVDGVFVDVDARVYVQYFNLDRKHSDCLLTGYSAKARMKVIERWHELENKINLPDFNNSILMARTWADDQEIKQSLALQAEEAIRTKALIGSKREATAMATASKQSRRVKALEAQLQDVGSHLSLIGAGLPDRVDTELKANVQTWRLLKEISTELGKDIIKVTDERYGKVNTYHVDVIEQFKSKFL